MESVGLGTVKLNEPSKKRGPSFIETLWVKASAREWSDRELSLQHLSDVSRLRFGPPDLKSEWGRLTPGSFRPTYRCFAPPPGSRPSPGHPWTKPE